VSPPPAKPLLARLSLAARSLFAKRLLLKVFR